MKPVHEEDSRIWLKVCHNLNETMPRTSDAHVIMELCQRWCLMLGHKRWQKRHTSPAAQHTNGVRWAPDRCARALNRKNTHPDSCVMLAETPLLGRNASLHLWDLRGPRSRVTAAKKVTTAAHAAWKPGGRLFHKEVPFLKKKRSRVAGLPGCLDGERQAGIAGRKARLASS